MKDVSFLFAEFFWNIWLAFLIFIATCLFILSIICDSLPIYNCKSMFLSEINANYILSIGVKFSSKPSLNCKVMCVLSFRIHSICCKPHLIILMICLFSMMFSPM